MDRVSVERGGDSGKTVIGRELPNPVLSTHFLELHPAVLEPDLDLSVREVHAPADLETPLAGQVHVEEELLLQLERLVFGVRAALLPAALRRHPAGRTGTTRLTYGASRTIRNKYTNSHTHTHTNVTLILK